MEQLLLLAKSARGSACVGLVQKAISSPQVYVFGELLALDNIRQLASDPATKPQYDLLEVFAYGTYVDYKNQAQSLPPLTPEQTKKLKQLTLTTLCSENKDVRYDVLLRMLEISNVRELEDLVIECSYEGLIDVKLDQKRGELHVRSAIGRDVRMESLGEMVNVLHNWHGKALELLGSITDKVNMANKAQEAHIANRRAHADNIENLKMSLKMKDPTDDQDMSEMDEGRSRGGKRSKAKHTSSGRERH